MPFKANELMAYRVPEVRQQLTPKDCMLYALGVGLGADPMDERQLKFVYEDGLQVLPTMAAVLAYPGFWAKDPKANIDWVKILHGEQDMTFHKPLPSEASLTGVSKIIGIADKGAGKGSIILSTREIKDAAGTLLATVRQTGFARGDGGSGSAGAQPEAFPSMPERKADVEMTIPTLPQAALIYRLSGDYNPLHADPKVAKAGGFPKPILHGLCTYGVAGHAVLATLCNYDARKMKRFRCRFTAPVYPGETLRTEMWKDKAGAFWRTSIPMRDGLAVAMGTAEIG
jgi:acyl dehydratase